ncbi:hypothetical protein ARMSODRAFT_975141 [Armillaria solidipes]|uniref:Uncharacterized protein n=1 Tax=Armillaria solidipes TaxID=1076256 RepID=A0A2H3BEY6_9AGAR|nr:hypothetical protein ARMSODRAFT_975141 [Armillaria solidipes]
MCVSSLEEAKKLVAVKWYKAVYPSSRIPNRATQKSESDDTLCFRGLTSYYQLDDSFFASKEEKAFCADNGDLFRNCIGIIDFPKEAREFLANNAARYHDLEAEMHTFFVHAWLDEFYTIFLIYWPPVDKTKKGRAIFYEASGIIRHALREAFHRFDTATQEKDLARVKGDCPWIIQPGDSKEKYPICGSSSWEIDDSRPAQKRLKCIDLFTPDGKVKHSTS